MLVKIFKICFLGYKIKIRLRNVQLCGRMDGIVLDLNQARCNSKKDTGIGRWV
jgi:hypothetical protein